MIDGLQSYPKMKNSHIRWFNQVPAHWRVDRLKNMVDLRVSNVDKHAKEGEQPVRLCNYVDVYKSDRIHGGMSFMRATATFEECERFRLLPNDVVITKDSESWTDIGVPSLVVEAQADLVCAYHLAILRPAGPDTKSRILGPYLFRAFQCAGVRYQMHVEANGVTRFGLSNASIGHLVLPVPPPDEQAAIVHFLNHADRRIRRYIVAKQKLIKLLEEQKQAIIHQAVTRGLDPNVPMKDSGIPWIGEIPAYWRLARLKAVSEKITSGSRGWAQFASAHGPLFLRIGNLTRSSIGLNLRDEVRLSLPPSARREALRTQVVPGDLLLSITAYIGSVAVVPEGLGDAYISQHIAACRLTAGNDPKWIAYVLLSRIGQTHGQLSVNGGTKLGLSLDDVGNYVLLLPPHDEQRRLVSQIETRSRVLDDSLSAARRELDLLQELRTRLIADVVTGQLDVRAAAAALPELPDEDAPDDAPDVERGLDEGLDGNDNGEDSED